MAPLPRTLGIMYGQQEFPGFEHTDQRNFFTPTPKITTDSSTNRDGDGRILSIKNTIKLDGKILGYNTSGCLRAYSGIIDYFSDIRKQGSEFKILCVDSGTKKLDNDPLNPGIMNFSGVYYVNSSFSEGKSNWAGDIDYSINLETVYRRDVKVYPYDELEKLTDPNYRDAIIESYEDTWNIEPIDSISHYQVSIATNYLEYKSPGISNTGAPSLKDLVGRNKNIDLENSLQFKITHRVSAVGKRDQQKNNIYLSPKDRLQQDTSAYLNAAKFVKGRLEVLSKTGKTLQEIPGLLQNQLMSMNSVSNQPLDKKTALHLYNHVRTIESSMNAGSYGVTDTWLAMPTGMTFPITEDFTMEVATDEKYLKTVTLQGKVQGLEYAGGVDGGMVMKYLPTGNISVNTLNPVTQYKTQFFDGLNLENEGSELLPYYTKNNKFNNAINAYQTLIKPMLYRRASAALNSVSRNVTNEVSDTGTREATLPSTWINSPVGYLNVAPVNFTESLNPAAGTVDYTVTYNNKPGLWISGVLSASISVTDNNPVDVVADVFVLGRPLGPILEKVGTSKRERSINIELVYPVPRSYQESHPNSPQCIINENRSEYKELTGLINSFKPIGANAFATLTANQSYGISTQGSIYTTTNNKVWNPIEGRLTWDITWVYVTGYCNYPCMTEKIRCS